MKNPIRSILTVVLASLAPAAAWGEDAASPKGAPMEYVRMSTTMGDIVLELNREKAPISVENFLSYAERGHYDGTIFHRVIPTFMIQGGGFTEDMVQKPTEAPIKNEWRNGLKNVRGSIAMARTPAPDSATSQFFINVVDNPFLDDAQRNNGAAYAVFGRVLDGMETVDRIRRVPTGVRNGMQDVPTETVKITGVARVDPSEFAELIEKARREEAEAGRAAGEVRMKALAAGIDLVKSKGLDVEKGRVSESGLWSLDAVEGAGDRPAKTSVVRVHYTGWLTNGNKFDSSLDRGQPAEFPLNGVIAGWTEGVSEMKVGGKRYLVIPPELGYGARGGGPIPANSVLVFEVELLDIVKK